MAAEAEITVQRAPEESVHRTARTVLVALHWAEAQLDIHDRANAELPVGERANRVLKAAQSGSLDPSLYKICWFLSRIFRQ